VRHAEPEDDGYKSGERDRPGVSTNVLSLFFLPRGKRVRELTYLIVQVLYEGISAGLAAQRASLMKEIVESHEFTKLGEDLDESVSGGDEGIIMSRSGSAVLYSLIDGWMKIADV
jgi:hypothetical protein